MHLRQISLPNGILMPTLGLGTWQMGESALTRKQEIEALSYGIDLGMTLIDTAEMYADGRAEKIVAKAISGKRDQVFLVSKVLPGRANKEGTITACEESLRRLETDYLDLYLLHWRGHFPLEETLEAFEKLESDGKIRACGVSNFDLSDMQEISTISKKIAVNQVLYSLASRGIEWDLLPWHQKQNIPVMAYSPLYQTHLLKNKKLQQLAKSLSFTPAQIALAWLLSKGVIPIPKSSNIARIEENRKAWDIVLDSETLSVLDTIFPPPIRKMPLDIL